LIYHYRIVNKDKCNEYQKLQKRKYLKENPEKVRLKNRNWVKNKRNNDPVFKLRCVISTRIRESINKSYNISTNSMIDVLGCEIEFFKKYLESKFEPWMTWENRGKYNGEFNYGWDIDHIIPISSANSIQDVIKLNHYTNLQPLCGFVNRVIKKTNNHE